MNRKILPKIMPFTDVFYRACFYNVFFTLANYYSLESCFFMANTLILHKFDNNLNMNFGVEFYDCQTLTEQLKNVGFMIHMHKEYSEIENMLIYSINNLRPAIIGTDCYYMSNRTDLFLKHHWPHNILVYGYDLSKEEFYVIDHDNVNSLTYGYKTISFHDTRLSVQSFDKLFYKKTGHIFAPIYFDIIHDGNNETRFKQDYIQIKLLYQNNLKEHHVKVQSSIENLEQAIEYILTIILDSTALKGAIQKLIFNLNSIINAKQSEYYFYSKMFSDHTRLLKKRMIILEQWISLRNIVEKYRITGFYNASSFLGVRERLRVIVVDEKKSIELILSIK